MFSPITIKNQPLYSDFEGFVNVECGTTGDWGSGSRGPAQRLTKRAACPHAAASWEHGKPTRSGVLGRPPTTSTHARNKARTHTVGPGRGLMYVHTKKRAKERPEHRLLPFRQRAALVCAYIYQCLPSIPPPRSFCCRSLCGSVCCLHQSISRSHLVSRLLAAVVVSPLRTAAAQSEIAAASAGPPLAFAEARAPRDGATLSTSWRSQ